MSPFILKIYLVYQKSPIMEDATKTENPVSSFHSLTLLDKMVFLFDYIFHDG